MSRRNAAPLGWLALLLAAYLCAPLLSALPQIGTSDWRGMDVSTLSRALLVSVASASVATVLIGLGGIPLGYLLARSRSRALGVLGFVVQLPLALPPLASGVLLLFLFGPYSPVGLFAPGLTDSFTGIVLAQIFVAAPFLIVAARSGFGALDPGLEDVAATLGHGPWRCFISISLPLAWATIRAGLLLSWLRGFGEFGATVMVAYHPYSLPVYTYVAFGGQGLPAMLPLLVPTLAIAIAVALLASWQRRITPQRIDDNALTADNLLVPRPASSPSIPSSPASLSSSAFEAQPGVDALPTPSLRLRVRQQLGEFTLDIDWHARSRRLAILGASGSGKSMTLRLLAGLTEAPRQDAAGPAHTSFCSLIIGEESLSALVPAARELGYVPQDYGLFPHMTVAEQLAFPVGAQAALARDWLLHLGLSGLEARKPAALSLGQRQRVALARALVRPCRLILLDEPFSALDTPRRRQLRQTLRALQNELSATTILVTHDPDEAALLADEILVLDRGQVLQAGKTAALFSRPASLQVAALLGITNLGVGHKCTHASIAIGGGVELIVDPAAIESVPDETMSLLWRIDPCAVRVMDSLDVTQQTTPGVYPAHRCEPTLSAGVWLTTVSLGGMVLRSTQPPGDQSDRSNRENQESTEGEFASERGGVSKGRPGDQCWVSIAPQAIDVWRAHGPQETPGSHEPLKRGAAASAA
ncbi:ATP-binding cassette domain-containing protein [Burkholderia sp. L27(2015)]|uniref:ABC transporter ATP-binding protein/permease n=1 Tax=Burkholderia sp. L27(2015) TaxID=1641858 RepID=UPI00131BDA3A|nr:ATP-binding cassette domain-containing protein [Burkholderia sp. L27(2015)]